MGGGSQVEEQVRRALRLLQSCLQRLAGAEPDVAFHLANVSFLVQKEKDMEKEKRDKVICFSLTRSMYDALHALAPSRDSLSALLREMISAYLSKLSPKQ